MGKSSKSKFELSMELCEFVSKYPIRARDLGSVKGKTVEAKSVLREALELYP